MVSALFEQTIAFFGQSSTAMRILAFFADNRDCPALFATAFAFAAFYEQAIALLVQPRPNV